MAGETRSSKLENRTQEPSLMTASAVCRDSAVLHGQTVRENVVSEALIEWFGQTRHSLTASAADRAVSK
jgi:hypothetical protein